MSGALQGRPVAVVGGGVAGLTAALALAQRGASVTVHERAGALREVGAGLQISPNAGRVLAALGLDDAFAAVACQVDRTDLRDNAGRRVATLDLRRSRPADAFRVVHRARLVEMLEEAARQAGVGIRLGDEVGAQAPEAALVVGADGLHSQQRAALLGTRLPYFTGQSAWRALIPEATDAPAVVEVFMGPRRHLVSYPLPNGLRNIVAVLESAEWTAEGWTQPGVPEDLRAAFAGFGGPVGGWLSQVAECRRWGLFRHPVPARWHDGTRVLIGDAAHPTLPFLAQGACMAIEDGWLLAACLDGDADQARALDRFAALRIPRVTRLVEAANRNARNYHLTGARRTLAHAGLRAATTLAPRAVFGRFAWVYDYDPTRDVPTRDVP